MKSHITKSAKGEAEMSMKMVLCGVASGALAVGLAAASPALAQQSAPQAGTATAANATAGTVDEIVVTAQKREQRLKDVGLTVTALSGDTLARQGITDVTQLAKVVPGLSYFTSTTATPVYSLRGVGFNESSLAAYPTASIYVDEVPLPFPAMAAEAGLDVARVEVLKGPQGTLFGQNSTAGAINYIAATPTPTFSAGADASYSTFNTFELNAFLSGPINDRVGMRLSLDSIRGDDWQKSYTRPGDTLGSVHRDAARLLVVWDTTDKLRLKFDINGWVDKSEPTAAQLVAITPATPAAAFPALLNYPLLPDGDARLADWSPNWGIRADDRFWQASLRADYDLGGVTLTSITSYADYRRDQRADLDGMSLDSTNFTVNGRIKSFFQEVRLANSDAGRLRWIVGANYSNDKVFDNDLFAFGDATGGRAFGISTAGFFSDQKMNNYAAFGNVEFSATDQLTLKAGARYTKADRTVSTCSYDTGDGTTAAVFTYIARLFNPAAPAVAPGGCFTINPVTFVSGLYQASLNEDNVSWRVGADFKVSPDILLYANVAQGYKAGGFPTVQASFQSQFAPVTQESLLDYEAGAKIQALDRRLAIDASVFYYDYRDKQLRGKLIDPVFGPLEALQNIPKSSVKGAELAVSAVPVDGLRLGASATWLDATIDEFTGVNGAGVVADFAGAPMPYTPKFQLAANSDYEFPLGDTFRGFVGGNLIYHTRAYAAIGTDSVPGIGFDRDLRIKPFATLDLRAGVASGDGAWRVTVWGKNVTNEYYWNNVARISDVIVRYAGAPRTIGLTVSFRH